MPSARVIVDDRFKQFGAESQRAVERAMGHAAAATVAASRVNPGGYQIEPILASIKATPVHRIRKGWQVYVYAEDFRAVLFAFGTYSRRRKALSPKYHRTPKAAETAAKRGTGVKAQPFLQRGVRVARVALLAALQRELGR